ncbi:homoserine kinase [Vitreoscilla stercoraria]|uniref:Homoserine kinase n=1 Tax=Vitreoscilla stercoraria TaxID=61 RepID=A0ABY4EBQ1_VITST|nr:homoserine kinase [Vitreoscilla stercoraria]UOO93172.1 homoserine kinase [Vitreoscilla stercoraria]
MSVYTSVSEAQMRSFLSHYDLGEFTNLKGIAQGVTNTNYFVTTTKGRFVLTLFEVLSQDELPFYLQLMQHLSQNNVACPKPIAQINGQLDANLAGKPACLVSCLHGADVAHPTAEQCHSVGKMLAKMHVAGSHFEQHMDNPRGKAWWTKECERLLPLMSYVDATLLKDTIAKLNAHDDSVLPSGIIHADLFKDNVLLHGDDVAGFIDFYYACHGNFMYDLAIALNDWARTDANHIDAEFQDALLAGYMSVRPLSKAEQQYLPLAQEAACIRFWVSRLLDYHFPPAGELTFTKNPDVFRDLLLKLQQQ